MSCSSVSKRGQSGLAVGPVLAGLLVLSGCSNEYDPDLKYPLRTDPIVTERPTAIPSHIDRPGDFPHTLTEASPEDQKKILNPEDIKAEVRQKLEALLDDTFGAPAEPKVGDLKDSEREALKLDKATLARGSSLYRLHCLHCHGLSGNGRGPTAPWVNPHPRDYRQGIFKFTSTTGGNDRKPRRADLHRTVREGVDGTTMPAFSLLSDAEIEDIISYVMHLSIRGEVEFNVMKDLLKQGSAADDLKGSFGDAFDASKEAWLKAADPATAIKPNPAIAGNVQKNLPPTRLTDEQKRAVQHGWELFRSTKEAGCIGCHQDYGRQGNYFYDEWGTIGRPADLTLGIYRGGRRPIDLFYRIHSGVNGANMPAFGKQFTNEQDIWDLVSFLEVLPYPKMREKYGINIDGPPSPEPAAQ